MMIDNDSGALLWDVRGGLVNDGGYNDCGQIVNIIHRQIPLNDIKTLFQILVIKTY